MTKRTLLIAWMLLVALATYAVLRRVTPATVAQPDQARVVARPSAAARPQVALDCNRPQGHRRWSGNMIVPQDETVMRIVTGDDHQDIDIKGWLCVIDAEPPKT